MIRRSNSLSYIDIFCLCLIVDLWSFVVEAMAYQVTHIVKQCEKANESFHLGETSIFIA